MSSATPIVVLHHPRELVNVAGVVRVLKNFGISQLRLVRPAEYDPYRIGGIAHKSDDFLKRVRLFEELDEALADCVHVVGLTARQRSAKRNIQLPKEAIAEILEHPDRQPAALLFGPEDRGLTNDELDRCHRVVTIPTDPSYPSLNLVQAVAIMAYEFFQARGVPPFKPPRRPAPPATREQLERLFADVRRALEAIDFFKRRHPEAIMRTMREVVHRASLDARETELGRAICFELIRAVERQRGQPG